MGNKNRDSRNENDHMDNGAVTAPSETPKAAQFADFPGVDSKKVTLDLSAENPTDVVNPHKGLHYHLVNKIRPGKIEAAQRVGYMLNPPDASGNLAKTVGDNPDCVLMACRREVYEARQGMKADKVNAANQASDDKASQDAARAGGDGVSYDHVIKRRVG